MSLTKGKSSQMMMFRDLSGLTSEMDDRDECAVVANSLIDFWGDIPDNCVLPNKKRTGIDDGQGGSNGYSRSIISKSKNASNQFTADNGGGSSTLVDFGSNGDNMPGGGGGGSSGLVDNSDFGVSDVENMINDIGSTIDAIHLGARLLNSIYPESEIELGTYIISDGTNYSTYGLFIGSQPSDSRGEYLKMQYSSTDIPDGWEVVGTYHTHNNNTPFSTNDLFQYSRNSDNQRLHILDNKNDRIILYIESKNIFFKVLNNPLSFQSSVKTLYNFGNMSRIQAINYVLEKSGIIYINTNRKRNRFKILK